MKEIKWGKKLFSNENMYCNNSKIEHPLQRKFILNG